MRGLLCAGVTAVVAACVTEAMPLDGTSRAWPH
jgi:hypothetical protein